MSSAVLKITSYHKDTKKETSKNERDLENSNTSSEIISSVSDTFTRITKEYDNKLYTVFKTIIDEAITDANNKKMDPVKKFIHINRNLKTAYIELAKAIGLITDGDNPPISEDLYERIDEYMQPIIEAAKMYIRQKAENVLASSD